MEWKRRHGWWITDTQGERAFRAHSELPADVQETVPVVVPARAGSPGQVPAAACWPGLPSQCQLWPSFILLQRLTASRCWGTFSHISQELSTVCFKTSYFSFSSIPTLLASVCLCVCVCVCVCACAHMRVEHVALPERNRLFKIPFCREYCYIMTASGSPRFRGLPLIIPKVLSFKN